MQRCFLSKGKCFGVLSLFSLALIPANLSVLQNDSGTQYKKFMTLFADSLHRKKIAI